MYVISLTGDRYQIGFQHGRKLKALIHYAVRRNCRFYKDRRRPTPAALQRRTNAIESSFPELIAEIRGIADGSQQPFDDILIYNLSPVPDACSNVAFLRDCNPMLGHVNDDQAGSPDVAFCIRPTDGPEILQIGVAGSVGAGAALNSGGLAMSHACARSGGMENEDACLNLPLLRRLLVDRNANCQEARDFLSTHCFASGADNIICVDRAGNAFVAEKLPTLMQLREPTGRGIYCTGRPLAAAIRSAVRQSAYEEHEPRGMALLLARETLFERTLADPERMLSLNLMKQTLQNSDEGIAVSNELSAWAAALVPSDFEIWIADRFPCHGKFTRIRHTRRCRFI
jgi:hypothetical protein